MPQSGFWKFTFPAETCSAFAMMNDVQRAFAKAEGLVKVCDLSVRTVEKIVKRNLFKIEVSFSQIGTASRIDISEDLNGCRRFRSLCSSLYNFEKVGTHGLGGVMQIEA